MNYSGNRTMILPVNSYSSDLRNPSIVGSIEPKKLLLNVRPDQKKYPGPVPYLRIMRFKKIYLLTVKKLTLWE